MNKFKKFLSSSLVEKILVSTVASILLIFITWLWGKYLLNLLKIIGRFLLNILTFGVPVWIIIITTIIIFGIFKTISKITVQNNEHKPDFLQYKEDMFKGLKYKWTYLKDYDDSYTIDSYGIFCPKCGCQIIDTYGIIKCIQCGFLTSFNQEVLTETELKVLVEHKIHSKKYLNVISK